MLIAFLTVFKTSRNQKAKIEKQHKDITASINYTTTIQKAINYAMTSVLTTGGIRGKKHTLSKFQPRSFNMGLSQMAFDKTKGFGSQHFGEDIDLTFRLWKNGFETQLIDKAFVYHKRRIDLKSFFKQTFNFGAARPILNKQHPGSAKITYWFPSLFLIGFLKKLLKKILLLLKKRT